MNADNDRATFLYVRSRQIMHLSHYRFCYYSNLRRVTQRTYQTALNILTISCQDCFDSHVGR
jgi:hypothetical protein